MAAVVFAAVLLRSHSASAAAAFLLQPCRIPDDFLLQPLLFLPRSCCNPADFLPRSPYVSAPTRVCCVPAATLLDSCCVPVVASFVFCFDAPALLLDPSAFLIEFLWLPLAAFLLLRLCTPSVFLLVSAASLLRSCCGADVLLLISFASLLLFLLWCYAQPEPLIPCFFKRLF